MRILILLLFCSNILFAQTVGVELTVTEPGSDCQNGERLAFYDDNNDKRYDRLTKFFCDGTYEDFILDSQYHGYLESSMKAHCVQDNFQELIIYVQILDMNNKMKALLMYWERMERYALLVQGNDTPLDETLLKVTPNPAKDRIEIENKVNNDFPILVFDELGKDVTPQINVISNYSTKIQLDVSSLMPGAYLVRIGEFAAKFVKI